MEGSPNGKDIRRKRRNNGLNDRPELKNDPIVKPDFCCDAVGFSLSVSAGAI
jgi:hypothetical protein